MQREKYFLGLLIATVIFFAAVSRPAFGFDYEQFTDRKASDILPSEKLSGEHYKIKDVVGSYGYMNHFTVDSDYGVFDVTGNAALRKLLREIGAMTAFRKIESTDAFGKALAESAKKPLVFAGNLVTHPVDTVTGIPKGVGRLFSNAYTSITTEKQAGEDSEIESLLSLSKYKREYAFNLGVDPYSSNALFQKELNRVAWAAAVGNLSFSAATAPIGGGVGMAISYTGFAQTVNEYLKDQPPSQIRSDAAERLSSMGVSKEDIDKFLDNDFFSPRHTTVIVASLRKLDKVKGREAYIQYVSGASDEEQADFMMHLAEMLKGYHEKVSPLREIVMNSGLVTASLENGTVLIPFPADYIVWTVRTETILKHIMSLTPSSEERHFEVWVTGTFSPLARKNIETMGIKVVEKADEKMEFLD